MTIEEKRKRISDYCFYMKCANCVLDGKPFVHDIGESEHRCIDEYSATNEELDEAIRLIDEDEDAKDSHRDKYDRHFDICRQLNDTYRRKNEDYGDSFGKGFREYGILMAVIRLEDKFNRFKKLAMSGEQKVKDESVRDTLIDLANYALMTLVEMDGEKQ